MDQRESRRNHLSRCALTCETLHRRRPPTGQASSNVRLVPNLSTIQTSLTLLNSRLSDFLFIMHQALCMKYDTSTPLRDCLRRLQYVFHVGMSSSYKFLLLLRTLVADW